MTGGSRGIGAAISKALAIRRAIERVVDERVRLDILVNNAGIALATPTDELRDEIDLGR